MAPFVGGALLAEAAATNTTTTAPSRSLESTLAALRSSADGETGPTDGPNREGCTSGKHEE